MYYELYGAELKGANVKVLGHSLFLRYNDVKLIVKEVNMKEGLKYTATAKWLHWFIGAALYHHFIQKDQVLKRMIPYGKVD